ncbi:MAG: hypothetical protein MI867_12535 [Pseudomonadales bacterium]|nr:hypothetical protein [Pseudomonadales bacterium]
MKTIPNLPTHTSWFLVSKHAAAFFPDNTLYLTQNNKAIIMHENTEQKNTSLPLWLRTLAPANYLVTECPHTAAIVWKGHCPIDRYLFDYELPEVVKEWTPLECNIGKDRSKDVGIWVNRSSLSILTYFHSNITLSACSNLESFEKRLKIIRAKFNV